MYRSFTDRVLGGVCGGLGALLPINAWWLRLTFAILTLLTTGAFALLYLALWLAIPQDSPIGRRRSGAGLFLVTLVLIAATLLGWFITIQGGLRGPAGESLYWPALLLALSLIFFVRQVRG
jgi:phage shock protein PspC (stress-responsive transcriptional regulator)